jgi:hypothetical protein
VLINERPKNKRNPEFDSEASLAEAHSRLPIERVMEQFGHTPSNPGAGWKRMKCPFCNKSKMSAGTFQPKGGGPRMFKCHSTSCVTGAVAMAPIEYIMRVTGEDRKQAFVNYLKMADVWKERTRFKKSEPDTESSAARNQVDEPSSAPADSASGSTPTVPLASAAPAAGTASIIPGPAALTGPGNYIGPERQLTWRVEPDAADILFQKINAARGSESDDNRIWSEEELAKLPSFERQLRKERNEAIIAERKRNSTKATDAYAVLREFYRRLALNERDEAALFHKRGLESRTSEMLGFKSNPRTNRPILESLAESYPMEELVRAGLYSEFRTENGRKARKPNSQFCGAGIVGKVKSGLQPTKDQWVDKDGNIWGWCEPILIPYFDEEKQLIGLRPHKGGGAKETVAGTPKLYIPRRHDTKGEEQFDTAIITEGEFKAAALWQTVGAGRQDGGEPKGVSALPGIYFGNHYETREVLEDWLRRIGCRNAIIGFDSEEKTNPAFPGYKSDRKKAFDVEIWARFLATDLHNKLHIRGEVCVLPREWRNEKGKADWDGELAKYAA